MLVDAFNERNIIDRPDVVSSCMDVDALVKRYPRLFHMAEKGTWPSIKKHGLLSTSAVLDLHQCDGDERRVLEIEHRRRRCRGGAGANCSSGSEAYGARRLAQGLQDYITPLSGTSC